MARATHRLFTIEDMHDLPDDGCRYELSRGMLIAEPQPGGRHGLVVSRFAYVLMKYAERTGDGVVLTGDSGFVLAQNPDTLRAPDIAWVRLSRYAALTNDLGFLPLQPDLAVEVLSPSNRLGALRRKLRDYFEAGTRRVWFADPGKRTLTVHKVGAPPETLTASMTIVDPELLPGFEERVATFFRSPFD